MDGRQLQRRIIVKGVGVSCNLKLSGSRAQGSEQKGRYQNPQPASRYVSA